MTTNIKDGRETMEQMYLDRDQMGDVTFLVEDQRIRAHRSILAAVSPKYRAQFYGPHRDIGVIQVPNASAAAFNVFLQFFYKKTIALTMDNIEAVLELAQQSLVDEFIETCVNFLKSQIKASNFCVAYRLAKLCDIESLRLECERQINTNTAEAFASDDFLHCDRDMLLGILRMDMLDCKEKDVFAACIAWAREQCKRINTDDGKPASLRAALGDAIYQIRFSSFTAEEFADLHKSMEGFFTADESFEVFYITRKLKDFESQKFNQTARTSQSLETLDERKLHWWKKIDRFEHKNNKLSFESVDIGRVKFESDQPIKLYGIALGVRFNQSDQDKFPESLHIHVRQVQSFVLVQAKYKIFQSQARHDETIILFERPIMRGNSFSIDFSQLPIKQLNYELALRHSVQESGTNFTFESEWITRVFFEPMFEDEDSDEEW